VNGQHAMIPFAPVDITRTFDHILSATRFNDPDSESTVPSCPTDVLLDAMACHTETLVLTGLSMWHAMTALDALIAAQIRRD
jgi:hypothetical protein